MSKFARQAASTARSFSRARTFTSTAIPRKDLVQELYIKELKGYKAPPQAKDAHVGVVKTYSSPQAPKPPTLPSDLASELSAYDSAEPVSATDPKAAAAPTEKAGTGADAYLSFLEQDLPKHDEAHH